MKLNSQSLVDGQMIGVEYAFAKDDPKHHVTLSNNRNPHFAWSDAPTGTKSFALICHDPDVPSKGDDVNQEGREVSVDLARIDFFHWVLIDIPAAMTSIKEGEFSSTVTGKGKRGPSAIHGTRQGVNDYTAWFASDRDMVGDYFGYDGPCPPWNDALMHRYIFTVYALDVETLPIEGKFGGADALKVINGHKLASASMMVKYSLNPRLLSK